MTNYTEHMPNLDLTNHVDRVVVTVLDDITDRRGFKGAWSDCDPDVKTEIIQTLREKVGKALEPVRAEIESALTEVAASEHAASDGHSAWWSFPDYAFDDVLDNIKPLKGPEDWVEFVPAGPLTTMRVTSRTPATVLAGVTVERLIGIGRDAPPELVLELQARLKR